MPQAHGKHARSHSCTGGSGGVTRKKRIGDVPGRSLRQCATKMMGSRATHGRGARAGLSSDGQEPSLAGFGLSAPDVSAREAAAKLIIEVEQKKKEFDALKRSGGGGVAGAEEEEEASATGRSTQPVVNTCLKKYYHDFINVVSISDVLLQVLDARDPMACRLTRAEEEIRSRYNERKQFILVLNKIDLIPHEIAIQWVEYFTLKGHRCIPFSTARQSLETETGQLTRRCIDQLYAELRNITRCPTTGCHRSITVGVIGYPNVGKSSLINALKRKAVVGVANQAGSTRGLIEVDLRKNIKIVDCPGILFDMNQKPEDLVLLNAVRLSEVSDPISVVNHVGSRVGWDRLCQHYQIPFASDLTSFLRHLCRKQGRLLSGGGGYDETGCAKGLLRDWNTSAIPFYALPPVEKAWVPSVLQDEDAGPTDAVLVLRRGPDPVVTSFADNAMRNLFDGGRDRAGNLLPQSQYDMMDPDNTSHPSSRVMKKTERRT